MLKGYNDGKDRVYLFFGLSSAEMSNSFGLGFPGAIGSTWRQWPVGLAQDAWLACWVSRRLSD